jgi:hypothetical protein
MRQVSASPVVLVSFQTMPPNELLASLQAGKPLREPPPWVFRCGATPGAVARALARLHNHPNLHPSGAILAHLPAGERLWLAYEWRGRLVVEDPLLDALGEELAGWKVDQRLERDHLLVLSPRKADTAPSTDNARGDDVGGLRVDSAQEFTAAVKGASAATVLARPHEVQASLGAWFGRLADPHVGGAIALAMTAPRDRTDPSLLVLHSPAALGLAVGEPLTELDRPAAQFGLSTQAWGMSDLGKAALTTALLERESQLEPGVVEEAVARHAQPPGCDYAIVAVMHAQADPTVHVPAGAVFEQTELRPNNEEREQNLVVARPASVAVPLGAFTPVILPAWCMNMNVPAPHGGSLQPTALFFPDAPTDQGDVWQRIADATKAA